MIPIYPRRGGGVTVPSGVFIQPDQAYVTGAAQYDANLNSLFAFGSIGATSFSGDGGGSSGILRNRIAEYYNSHGSSLFDLSGNNVTNPSLIDDILAEFVTNGISSCTIDVSGGTMAAISPSTPGSSFIISGAAIFQMGVMDSPTGIQIATEFATLFNATAGGGLFVGWSAQDNGDGTVTITDTTPTDFPFTLGDFGSGITFREDQVGSGGTPEIFTLDFNGTLVPCTDNSIYFNMGIPAGNNLISLRSDLDLVGVAGNANVAALQNAGNTVNYNT